MTAHSELWLKGEAERAVCVVVLPCSHHNTSDWRAATPTSSRSSATLHSSSSWRGKLLTVARLAYIVSQLI